MDQERDSFAEAMERAVTPGLRAGEWRVCEEYETHVGKEGRYIQAPPSLVDSDGRMVPEWWPYRPLVKHRDLFLKFARLADSGGLDGGEDLDTDKNADAAKEWADEYGVLGLTLRWAPGRHSPQAEPSGGEGDTVAAFAAEAWAANRALRLYEAATREGGVDVGTIASLMQDPVHAEDVPRWPQRARGTAFRVLIGEIMDRRVYYHEAPYWPVPDHTPPYEGDINELRPAGEFVEGWEFTNLLGCIWLQAYWLLRAGSVRRCAYPRCNRIIDYEQPTPKPSEHKKGERKKQKRRKDIKFCPTDTTGRHCKTWNFRMKERLQREAARRVAESMMTRPISPSA